MPTFLDRAFGDTFGDYFGLLLATDPFPPATDPTLPIPRRNPAFKVTLYDKTFNRLGWIGRYESFNATVRHNAISTAEIVVPLNHPRIADLMTPGCRVVIEYDDHFLMSGTIRGRAGQGPAVFSTLTVSVTSDLSILSGILGWQAPANPLTAQNAQTYYTVTGAAETVVKTLARVNAARLGLPLTVAPDLHRGATITIQSRMSVLSDILFPAVTQAGIGVSVQQAEDGSGLVLDCYTPTTRTRVLSESSGALVNWNWTQADPTLSRVVIGGPSKGTDREFIQIIDAPLEASLGWPIEGFVDASSVETNALMTPAGQEALTGSAAAYGFALTLAETNTFKYGPSFLNVGDSTPVLVAPGETVVDVVGAVSLADTADEGVSVTPVIGTDDSSTPDAAFISAVKRIGKKLRALGSQQ